MGPCGLSPTKIFKSGRIETIHLPRSGTLPLVASSLRDDVFGNWGRAPMDPRERLSVRNQLRECSPPCPSASSSLMATQPSTTCWKRSSKSRLRPHRAGWRARPPDPRGHEGPGSLSCSSIHHPRHRRHEHVERLAPSPARRRSSSRPPNSSIDVSDWRDAGRGRRFRHQAGEPERLDVCDIERAQDRGACRAGSPDQEEGRST